MITVRQALYFGTPLNHRSPVPGEPWKWPLSLPERLHVGLFDPAFGWHLSRSHASEGMTLPAQDWPQDWPPEIRRAHRHLLDRDEEDDNLALAQALHLPQNLAERDLMWALLICQDASFEMIADVFNYEVDVVRLVDTLFWNFRDRKHEPLYVAQVLNGPQAGQVPVPKHSASHGVFDLI